MLQAIYNRTQGWIAWIIVVIIAITFLLFGIENYQKSNSNDAAKAEVNGVNIPESEFRTTYERLRRQRQAELGVSFTPAVDAELKQYVLQQLILDEVLKTAATESGFNITPEQAQTALMRIPAFQQDGHFSQEKFYQLLSSALFTPQTFLTQLQTGMLINQARASFVATEFTLANEVSQVLKLARQQRTIQYLVIPSVKFANKVAKPDSKEINAYYQKHQKEFMMPEKVRIEYVVLSQEALEKQIVVSDEELQEYFDRHQDNYKNPAKWQIAHILVKTPANFSSLAPEDAQKKKITEKLANIEQALKQNRNFSELAKQFSDDYFSASRGGALSSWLTAGNVEPALEKAIVQLKVGEASAPIKTKAGYEIVKLLKVQHPTQLSFAEVKPQIAKNIRQEKLQQQFANAVDEIGNIAYSNPDSLKPIADALQLPVQQSSFFTRKGGKDTFTADPKILSAVFSEDVLENGNNSDVIQFDTRVVVLRIKERQPSKVMPLKEAEAQISDKLINQAMRLKAEALGREVLTQLKAGKNVKPLLEQNGLQWKVQTITRDTQNFDPTIIRNAFSLPYSPTQKSPSIDGFSLHNGDFAIAQVMAVQNGNPSKIDNEQRRIVRDQIENMTGLLAYEFYVQGLMKNAKIKILDNPANKNQKSSETTSLSEE